MKKNMWEMDRKLFENTLVIVSIIFILSCTVFYGIRLVKYYKIYNPRTVKGEKVELFSATVRKANPVINENDGLYIHNGDFVFKGEDVNNYVSFSDKIWRIIRVNRDGTVKLILEESLTDMAFDTEEKEYKESLVYKYINDETNLKLNKNLLQPMTICLDKVDDVSKITCDDILSNQYVTLPSISDYINSLNEKSFINNNDNIWLYSVSSDLRAWNIDKGIITVDRMDYDYAVKAVVTLKGTAFSKSGDGSLSHPYVIEESV